MTELFENFEVNRDSRWSVVLVRLVGASLVLHLLLLWLVVYVPAIRDTVNIAALIASTRIVDEDYVATQIGDDVQLVQLTNEKFRYPEGYFALEAQIEGKLPAPTGAAADPFAAKVVSQWNPSKNVDPEPIPSPSPDASASPAASPSASPLATAAASQSPSAIAQASPPANSNTNTQLPPDEAQKKLEETAKENNLALPEENQINKKALKDFAAYANDLKNTGKLDLNKPFEVVIEAEMDQNGKLQNARFTKKVGDENLVDLFGRMIAALNDSGFLIYLQPLSKDNPGAKVVITIKQGESEVLATVASETTSNSRAETLAKVLNTALFYGAGSRSGKDEEVLMKNTNVTPDGKKVVVNFSMPRQSVVELIKKQLEPGV
ncbi:MAG: hypothetical protein LC794_13950 [Acidobacteria bacterium]|nr:hypothetical protein [Acidobacteriota bacterium]MCA1627777.1 hypothetical protein [Acidobacteriota bacterium]